VSKDSAKNSSFVQKRNSLKLRAESKPCADRDVNLIVMFKLVLFWFDTQHFGLILSILV
jgi:hypothetical protein